MVRSLTPTAADRRKGLWLALLLLTSITLGAAAALLGVTSASGPPGGGFALPFHVVVTLQELGWGILILLLIWLVLHLLQRRSGTYPIGSRSLSFFLVAFLVAVVFVLLFHALAPGTPGTGSNAVQNNTSNGPPTPLNNSSVPVGFQPVNFSGFHVPGWVLLLAFAGAAGVLALVAGGLLAESRRRPPDAATPPPVPGREELDAALKALENGSDDDPRAVIMRLYARLLRWVGPRVTGLETMTARDVERVCVERFGLRPETAHSLTAIFEEARYSTHPLAPETVERTRAVLSRALRELEPATAVA
jgi:hypothetical protein